MHLRLILLTALLLTPLPALGIGYVYTGVGDDGRQHLELSSVTVEVRIDERVARTAHRPDLHQPCRASLAR